MFGKKIRKRMIADMGLVYTYNKLSKNVIPFKDDYRGSCCDL
jgi:hypothetical protein